MKRRFVRVLPLAVLLAFCIGSIAFAFETPLKTAEASPSEIAGIFTLILYGGNYADDLETVALLDLEGDRYRFEPFAPDFDYRLRPGMQAKEAFATAEKFVIFHNAFWRSQLSKILDRGGNVIGFELRPLYRPFVYGFSDILDVNYWLKEDGKIKVIIRLIPEVERLKLPGFDDGSGGQN